MMICVYPEYHEGRILLILVIGTVTLGFAGADKTANTTGYLQVSSTPVRHSGFPGMLCTQGSPLDQPFLSILPT